MMIDTEKEGISITAGPEGLGQPFYSYELQDITEYRPIDVSEVLERLPGITITNRGSPQWWDWKAIYHKDEIDLTLGMSIFEMEKDVFCSLDFIGVCSPLTLIGIIQYLKHNGFPSLWFHNQDSEMFTPANFLERYSKCS
jgi:hypothetical protein